MKSMILNVSPKECADLLNGDLSILVRKLKANRTLPIEVYIYCTKEKKTKKWAKRNTLCSDVHDGKTTGHYQLWSTDIDDGLHTILNGKVVAKFILNKIEHLYEYQVDGYGSDYEIMSDTLKEDELLKKCHLTYDQLSDYLGDINNGYAWFIDDLVILDKPRELKEFRYSWCGAAWQKEGCHGMYCDFCEKYGRLLTKAPNIFCYVKEA